MHIYQWWGARHMWYLNCWDYCEGQQREQGVKQEPTDRRIYLPLKWSTSMYGVNTSHEGTPYFLFRSTHFIVFYLYLRRSRRVRSGYHGLKRRQRWAAEAEYCQDITFTHINTTRGCECYECVISWNALNFDQPPSEAVRHSKEVTWEHEHWLMRDETQSTSNPTLQIM